MQNSEFCSINTRSIFESGARVQRIVLSLRGKLQAWSTIDDRQDVLVCHTYVVAVFVFAFPFFQPGACFLPNDISARTLPGSNQSPSVVFLIPARLLFSLQLGTALSYEYRANRERGSSIFVSTAAMFDKYITSVPDSTQAGLRRRGLRVCP